MYVVQDDPVAVPMRHFETALGYDILPLSHRHIVIALQWYIIVLARQVVKVSHHVGASGEDEVDGYCR